MTISVVIPVYNYGRFVREAIDSALAQTCPPLEVIVVDDGSTDETPQVLSAYGDRIRIITQRNRGVSAARNAGIAAARGEYLAFLDADDVWDPHKLERDIRRFESDRSLGLVHCGAEKFDANGDRLSTSLTGIEGRVAETMLRLDREVIAAPGSGTMVPKRVAEEVGGFDQELRQSEDWDFCYRVAVRYPIGFVPEVLVRYRQHGAGIHLDVPTMERSMQRVLEKAFGSPDPSVQRLRRRSYGKLHCILAACYLDRRELSPFLRNAIASLRYDPRNFAYFAAYPLRLATRLFGRKYPR